MVYFLALIPATALTIAGYIVLYLSARSEGALRTFGKYLGFWAFTLAGLVILGAIFAAAHAGHHGARFGMHGRTHDAWPPGPRFWAPGEPGQIETPPGAAPEPRTPAPNPAGPPDSGAPPPR